MEMITLVFEGKPIHCFEWSGQMWFCGKDVCDVLGYAATSYKNALHKIIDKHPYSFFYPQAIHNDGLVVYISELGVIELTIKCRFETAKPFRAFIKKTIKELEEKENDFEEEKEETFNNYEEELNEAAIETGTRQVPIRRTSSRIARLI